MNNNCAVILAAGQGKRMKSKHAKVMCQVLFKPMIDWVCDSVINAGINDICVVTGHCSHEVIDHLGEKYSIVQQTERLGTGHAVMQADEYLCERNNGHVLVLCGDAPLMDSTTIKGAYEAHIKNDNAATIISANLSNPFGYGRIVRGENNTVIAIVEQRDADDETKAIKEINSGAYWFRTDALLQTLGNLSRNNDQGEYYLTEVISLLCARNYRVDAFVASDEEVVLGANDRVQLAYLNERARVKIIHKLMNEGVDIPFPDSVFISPDVQIGSDTQILPNTLIKGKVQIGCDCVIGPNCCIENTVIGDNVQLDNVKSTDSAVDENVKIGPFAQLRPNTHIMKNAKLGNYVEIKNSVIGVGSKVPHLTYVGDSDVGDNVNFGCGSVTVNYDGETKARCRVGDNAFIGCNTNLIAPVSVGRNVYTAAGSTVTEDVPDNSLAIARSRQTNKKDWVKNHRKVDK